MEKKDYAEMKVRENIVAAFVNGGVQDWDMLPAIIDYVMKGDISAFKEYKDWHLAKTSEERLSELRYKKEKAEGDFDMAKKEYDKVKETYEEYADEFCEWRKKFNEQIDGYGNGNVYLNNLMQFIHERNFDNYRKCLYVSVDGKLRKVNSVSIIDNKVVLSSDVNYIQMDKPPVLSNTLTVFYFNKPDKEDPEDIF